MNTIQKFQIFSPIPYTYYTSNKMDDRVQDDYKIDKVNDDVIDGRKGHFDRSNFEYLSFYAYDYILSINIKFFDNCSIMRFPFSSKTDAFCISYNSKRE